MTDSIRLGRIMGIPVGIHWGALAVAVVFAASLATSGLETWAPDTSITVRLGVASVGVVAFFACILAHELGHALVALAHGIEVNGITLWVLGGMARLGRQPASARAELQIAAAGPAVNLALGLFFVALGVIVSALGANELVVVILSWLGGVNLVLGVFNLLPAAPLDGGRVLTAVVWWRTGDDERARIVAGRCGLVLALGLVLVGTYLLVFSANPVNGILNLAIAALVYGAAAGEISSAVIRRRLATTSVDQVLTPTPQSVPGSATVGRLIQWAGPQDRDVAHPVVRWDHHPIGYVVPVWANSLSASAQSWTQVEALMDRAEQTGEAHLGQPVTEIIDRFTDHQRVLVVRDNAGTPVGTLTERQLRPLLTLPGLWGTERTWRDRWRAWRSTRFE